MPPLTIIEPFDERENLSTGLVPCLIRLVMDEFILQGAEEAFRYRVVVTIALPTHARGDPQGRQLLLIGPTGVLRSAIGVMHEPRLSPSLADRHGQRLQRELLIRFLAHGPADHPPGTQIE